MRVFYKAFFIVFLFLDIAKAEVEYVDIKILEHKFVPDVIYSTSDKVIKIRVENLDSTVEEFESYDLKREKIVPAKGKIIVIVGPLIPGEYKFFGEFFQDTAQGKLIIK